MGRKAKYSEDLLLEAVNQYSKTIRTKIKATELAEWARKEIVGLEGVQDYHFTRPIKNPVTGKMEKRVCAIQIEGLNLERGIKQRENTNVILAFVNIDRFYELDERSQRNAIQEARDILWEYKTTNRNLRRQNNDWKSLVDVINEKMVSYESTIKEIKKKQSDLDKRVASVSRSIKDAWVRKELEEMGITDGDFDLMKFNESLKKDMPKIYDIEKSIKKYERNLSMGDEEDEMQDEMEEPRFKTDLIDELTDF